MSARSPLRLLVAIACLGADGSETAATVVPFTEDFVADSANWR